MTRSVRDAISWCMQVSGRAVTRSTSPLVCWLAVPAHTFLRWTGWHRGHNLPARTLDLLRQAGAPIESIDLPETGELVNAGAGRPGCRRSYAWHRPVLARHAGNTTRVHHGSSAAQR